MNSDILNQREFKGWKGTPIQFEIPSRIQSLKRVYVGLIRSRYLSFGKDSQEKGSEWKGSPEFQINSELERTSFPIEKKKKFKEIQDSSLTESWDMKCDDKGKIVGKEGEVEGKEGRGGDGSWRRWRKSVRGWECEKLESEGGSIRGQDGLKRFGIKINIDS